MSGVTFKTVDKADADMRLDRWFRLHFPLIKHGALQKMLRKGQIKVDGARVKANDRLNVGANVRVPPMPESDKTPERKDSGITANDRKFVQSLVIYRDNDYLAVNKPSGLAVQGGSRQERHLDGLLDGLKFDASERPKLVHRLDKDTSGVLMLARSRAAAAQIGKLMKQHDTSKLYWALVRGVPKPSQGQINIALVKRQGKLGERMQVCEKNDSDGLDAVTRYAVIESAGRKLSFVALTPLTGRTHQLRVHMNAIGHPVIGDGKYGGADAHPGGEISKLMHLHARSFTFTHPKTKKTINILAPLPKHMASSWELFGFDGDSEYNPFVEASCNGGACNV